MNYYRRIWRSKKKASKGREVFMFLFVLGKNASRPARVSIAIAMKYFGLLQTIMARLQRNYFINIFFKQLFFGSYFISSTFVFYKTEYKDSIIIGSIIFKFPYASKDNPKEDRKPHSISRSITNTSPFNILIF